MVTSYIGLLVEEDLVGLVNISFAAYNLSGSFIITSTKMSLLGDLFRFYTSAYNKETSKNIIITFSS